MTNSVMTELAAEPGLEGLYAAPESHGALVREGEEFVAADSSKRFKVRGGVPHFLRYNAVETPRDTEKLTRLNQLAPQAGWRAALDEVYSDTPNLIDYVTRESRGAFMNLLPLTPQGVVLEVGTGLGQFTVPLARRSRRVYGLEVVAGQASFTLTRCTQSGVKNVSVACGGDDCCLPYASGCFDVVVMSLVLEWCGGRIPGMPLQEGQRRLLGEAARVLKPGGTLYVMTKNRFALRYLIGKADEHAQDLRFGSALPRWLLPLALKLRGKGPATGYLYSHNELARLLTRSGFGQLRSFWAAPEMRHPRHFIKTDAASIAAARREGKVVQGEVRSTRLLMPWVPAGMVKHVTPGLVFVGKRG